MPEPSNRIWTIPNALSMLRLLGVPLFVWLLLGPHADGWAVVVLMVAGTTDWLDGKLARKWGQTTKLGMLLDPAADRLYTLAALLTFLIRGIVPWWVVALLLGRDLVVAIALAFLRRSGFQALQVNYLGKAATFNLLSCFPLVLLGHGTSTAAAIIAPFGYGFGIWGIALYLISGVVYVGQIAQIVAAERRSAAALP